MLLLLLRGAATVALTASSLTAPAASLGSATLAQAHALTPASLSAPQAVAGSAALAQAHTLAADGLAASSAALSSPTLAQSLTITASPLVAPTAALASAALTQAHALSAASISAQPEVSSAELTLSGETVQLPPRASSRDAPLPEDTAGTTTTLAGAPAETTRLASSALAITVTRPAAAAGTELRL